MPDSWYITINGTEVGPLTLQELKATLATFADAKDMLVWRDGLADWKPVRDLRELLFQAAPLPPLPPEPSVQREAMRCRSNALSDIRPNGRNAAIKEKAKQSMAAANNGSQRYWRNCDPGDTCFCLCNGEPRGPWHGHKFAGIPPGRSALNAPP